MISGLLKVSGVLIMRLVYGKKYSENASKKNVLMVLLSIVNIFWLLSILFLISGIAANDTVLCVIISVFYPVAIAIWTVIERNKQV